MPARANRIPASADFRRAPSQPFPLPGSAVPVLGQPFPCRDRDPDKRVRAASSPAAIPPAPEKLRQHVRIAPLNLDQLCPRRRAGKDRYRTPGNVERRRQCLDARSVRPTVGGRFADAHDQYRGFLCPIPSPDGRSTGSGLNSDDHAHGR